MRIVIETIPHATQRYPTVGDWWTDPDGTWQIRVSNLHQPSAEFLVAVHELVEMALCKQHDVDEQAVTDFDSRWEPFGHLNEPGDDLTAPYYHEHQFACGIERLVAAQLGISWPWYAAAVDAAEFQSS
jgi:hypothetical protein